MMPFDSDRIWGSTEEKYKEKAKGSSLTLCILYVLLFPVHLYRVRAHR